VRIRNVHRQHATLIVDGVGEVPHGQEVEVPDALGKSLILSKHWHLVPEERPAAQRAAKEK
jgi:hypothetical protein